MCVRYLLDMKISTHTKRLNGVVTVRTVNICFRHQFSVLCIENLQQP